MGSPLLIQDLLKVCTPKARAIVLLANEGDAEKADSDTLRTVLAPLPDSCPVWPGHNYNGPRSTIGEERRTGVLSLARSREEWESALRTGFGAGGKF